MVQNMLLNPKKLWIITVPDSNGWYPAIVGNRLETAFPWPQTSSNEVFHGHHSRQK